MQMCGVRPYAIRIVMEHTTEDGGTVNTRPGYATVFRAISGAAQNPSLVSLLLSLSLLQRRAPRGSCYEGEKERERMSLRRSASIVDSRMITTTIEPANDHYHYHPLPQVVTVDGYDTGARKNGTLAPVCMCLCMCL